MAGNPAFNDKTFGRFRSATATSGADQMTMEGTTTKGMLLLGIAVMAGAFAWSNVRVNPGMAGPSIAIGAIGGFITAIITTFGPRMAPITGPIYALLEGVALGTISYLFDARYSGIALSAVVLTFSLLGVMFLLYRARVVRATPKLTKVVVGATAAIAITYLLSMVAGLFGLHDVFGLLNTGPIGVLISLAIIACACFNFVLDFDLIERGVQQGAPTYMEWYSAFGVMVTLVWLYLEVLRLLTKLQRD